MLTRNCPLANSPKGCLGCKSPGCLTDRKRKCFPVVCARLDGELLAAELLNSVPLWLGDREDRLGNMDFGVFRFTVENPVESGQVLEAFFRQEPLGCDYTRGAFSAGRGMTVENVVESVDSPEVPRREAAAPAGPGGTAACGKQEQEVVMMVMKWKRLHKEAQAPERQTPGSAGYDLCACIQDPAVIGPGDTGVVPHRPGAGDPRGPRGAWCSAAAGWGSSMGSPCPTAWGSLTATTGGNWWFPCGISGMGPTPSSRGSGLPSWSSYQCCCLRLWRWKSSPKPSGAREVLAVRGGKRAGAISCTFPKAGWHIYGKFCFSAFM